LFYIQRLTEQSQAQALREAPQEKKRVYVTPEVEMISQTVLEASTNVIEETISIAFRVECTKSQLQKLKEFLVENKIKYGKV
jgi:hypothetical protein